MALKSSTTIKFLYLAEKDPITSAMLFTCVIIELFCGLYEKQNIHFFLLRFISTEKPSLFENSIAIKFDTKCSRT